MQIYELLGQPLVEYNTFWWIYQQLLHAFEGVSDLTLVISAIPDTVAHINGEELPLLPEMKELCGGDGVIGDQETESSGGHTYAADYTDSESD